MARMKLRAPIINITPRPTRVEADMQNSMIGINANLHVRMCVCESVFVCVCVCVLHANYYHAHSTLKNCYLLLRMFTLNQDQLIVC